MTAFSRFMVYIIGGFLLSIAIYLILLQPTLNRISNLSDTDKTSRAEITRLEKQIVAYRTAQADLSNAINKDLLYSFSLEDKKLNIVIEEMEAVARKTGSRYTLKILRDSLDPLPETKNRNAEPKKKVTGQTELEEVPYTLTIQNNDYPRLVEFLQYLEHLPHFTEVSHMDVSFVDQGDAGPILTAIIDGVFLAKKSNEIQQTKPETK
jgi:hypothetical protein